MRYNQIPYFTEIFQYYRVLKIECINFNGCGWITLQMIATGHKGANVREVPAQSFVDALAKHFEKANLLSTPEWADLVKTGSSKQMPPMNSNWFFVRSASIARQVYLHPGASVQALKNRYGENTNNGSAPFHHGKASGKIIRACLHQLEKIDWVKTTDDGCVITPKGQKQLDTLAQEVAKNLKTE